MPENESIDQEQFWPGFTVKCNKCGGENVILENTLGHSLESGWWGELAMTCTDCDIGVEIYKP